ncbi:hypothetical protein DV736_g5932, partial [Chaetothyriales sp. CBS 134916]
MRWQFQIEQKARQRARRLYEGLEHGSASATKVPNVRMEKMPDYVPKVNSKWDGIPEQMKAKQKLEKQKQKARKRASLKSQSTDSSSQRKTDWSGSHTPNSMVSRSKSKTSCRSDSMKPNPHRFYATSCNSSGDLAAQWREDIAKDEHIDDRCKSPRSPQLPSFRPSSRRIVSESGSFYATDTTVNPSTPKEYCSQADPVPSLHAPLSPVMRTLAVKAIPKLTSSPAATSQERPMSPVKLPALQISDISMARSLDEALLQFEGKSQSQPRSNNQPATHRSSMKPVKLVSEGFLAGEAQEFSAASHRKAMAQVAKIIAPPHQRHAFGSARWPAHSAIELGWQYEGELGPIDATHVRDQEPSRQPEEFPELGAQGIRFMEKGEA